MSLIALTFSLFLPTPHTEPVITHVYPPPPPPPSHTFKAIQPIHIHIHTDTPKTAHNFVELVRGEKMSKLKRGTKLQYQGCKMHRYVKEYIIQGGGVHGETGGESIYGSTFNDEKPGLKRAFQLGAIGMANSGKNSNASQFFIVLTDDPASLAKLNGKYVCFGQIVSGMNSLLAALAPVESIDEKPSIDIRIEECSVLS